LYSNTRICCERNCINFKILRWVGDPTEGIALTLSGPESSTWIHSQDRRGHTWHQFTQKHTDYQGSNRKPLHRGRRPRGHAYSHQDLVSAHSRHVTAQVKETQVSARATYYSISLDTMTRVTVARQAHSHVFPTGIRSFSKSNYSLLIKIIFTINLLLYLSTEQELIFLSTCESMRWPGS
jgi:hypothetical protein